jgi:signal transduction histidine kinase
MTFNLLLFIFNFFINLTNLYSIRILIFFFFILIISYLIIYLDKDYKRSLSIHRTNINLSKIIDSQTHEIRKAYAIENRARKDLEKLNETKDQFIMITQHNLRSPITTIKAELELLINGHNGNVDQTALNSILRTKSSADRLSQIVDDFLNITTLKIGSQILQLASGNIKSIIENIVNDLRLDIDDMKLTINYFNPKNLLWDLRMDINKIREALTIIIENAIKYNFKQGTINISSSIVDDNMILSVENTGVGITDEENKNIFNKLFYRGIRARERNPIGMGIGLQVAKAIINGHKGQINIESQGENYGACVEIVLPLNSYNEA